MNRGLGKGMRRLLAIVLALVVLYELGFVLPSMLWDRYSETSQAIEERRLLLGRLNAKADALAKGTAGDPSQVEAQTKAAFLSGADEPLAVADLQARLSDMAAGLNMRPKSVGSLPGRDIGDLRLIGVRIQLTADIRQVHRFVHELETSMPVLIIEGAQWRAVAGDEPALQNGSLRVDVTLDVFGALSGKEAS